LWNEIGSADKDAVGDHALVVDWDREMCQYLKSIDLRHMTTNSLSSTEVWPEMWKLPENEFAQMHGYYYFSDEMKRDAKDMGRVLRLSGSAKSTLRQALSVRPNSHRTRQNRTRAVFGIAIHAACTCITDYGRRSPSARRVPAWLWWWHNYIDPKDLYFQFRPVAEFVKGVPWTSRSLSKRRMLKAVPEICARSVSLGQG